MVNLSLSFCRTRPWKSTALPNDRFDVIAEAEDSGGVCRRHRSATVRFGVPDNCDVRDGQALAFDPGRFGSVTGPPVAEGLKPGQRARDATQPFGQGPFLGGSLEGSYADGTFDSAGSGQNGGKGMFPPVRGSAGAGNSRNSTRTR